MKSKLTLFLSTLFLSVGLQAQSGLDNLDFEDWEQNGLSEDQPVGFASLGATRNMGDPKEGSSAVYLEVYYNMVIDDTLAAVALGEISGTSNINIGEAYSNCPDSLTGYVRHELLNEDTATIRADVWTSANDTLASTELLLGGTQGSWTRVSLPFDPMDCNGNTPDTVGIYMTAESVGFDSYVDDFKDKGTQSIGSVLELDAFYLHDSTTTSVVSLSEKEEKHAVYPNPAKDEVRFEFGSGADRIRIFDMTGREAKEVLLNGVEEETSVDLEGMNEGLYVYRIEGSQGQELHSGKLQVLR